MIRRWKDVGLAFLLAGVTACGKKEVTEPKVACVVSVSALAFGNVDVGQTKDLTFRVEDRGRNGLLIFPRTCAADSVGCETCPDFSILGESNYVVIPGGAVTITIRFAPSSPGVHTCFVRFLEDCPRVALDGTGGAGATRRPTRKDNDLREESDDGSRQE